MKKRGESACRKCGERKPSHELDRRWCAECRSRRQAWKAARSASKASPPQRPAWSEADKEKLADAVTLGMTREEAADHCGRTVAAVINMHFRMGLPPFAKAAAECFWIAREAEMRALLAKGWNGARIARAWGTTRLATYSAIHRMRKRNRRPTCPSPGKSPASSAPAEAVSPAE